MKFRLQTDYALRALTFLAAKGTPATTDEIANHYAISSAHLGRVIRRLQNMGFMKAVRGRKGGVRLARDAKALTLGEVIAALEDNGQLMDGLKPGQAAGAYTARLAGVLRRGYGMFSQYLSRATFADIASDGLVPEQGTVEVPAIDEPFLMAEKLDHPMPAVARPS